LAALLVAAVVVQTLQSVDSLSPMQWAGATAGILVGAFIAYLIALPSRVVFDSAQREMRVHHSRWPGRGETRCAFDDLTDVEVHTDASRAERIALLTSRGPIPLTRHFSGFEPHDENARAIKTWLGDHGCELPRA